MREPSSRGIRGPMRRGCLFALLVVALFGAREAGAQDIGFYYRDTGNINFVTTGGSMRNSPNTGNPCSINATSSQALSGIPGTAVVDRAFLYWGASGNSVDSTVTLNGNNVTASRTFTRNFNNGTSFNFFGGFADVTTIVQAAGGNSNYTFGGLNVSTGTPWCASQAVVGGWSLIVIYRGASERLRAINLYDGLEYFYGSSVTQFPDGFRVPATNIDGRIAIFTLEGDPQNSGASGGFSEALRFNGTLLDDGLVPAGSDPALQQFDGTINTQGVTDSYGIDVDQYDVSSLLSPGQTSATTLYSSGSDLVLLMAQIVSATSDPAVNLGVTLAGTGPLVAGQTGTYTITVSNAVGFEREDNVVTVSNTLPAGLTFNSGTGTGWTCGAVGQVVTCTHAPTLNAGASFPPINLVVNVLESAPNPVSNTVTVSSASFDSAPANNTASLSLATIDPSVATSTKTVVDLNGGDAEPGDTLRYTITLNESAGGLAANVSLTDDIPENTDFAGVFSLPAGATSSFTPAPGGAFGNGVLSVSGINVPASGSVAVVFDVTVATGTLALSTIDNQALITNPNGPNASPNAPQVVVSASAAPSSGQKFIYLRCSSGACNTRDLSRTPPSGSDGTRAIGNGATQSWNLTNPLAQAMNIPGGNIVVRLWMRRSGNWPSNRNVTVTLTNSVTGTVASVTNGVAPPNSTTPTQFVFTLPNPGADVFPQGSTLSLSVTNGGSNTITVFPDGNGGAGNNSRIEINSDTVVNVATVETYNATFNGGTAQGIFYPGATVFLRANVTDPFGSADIGDARITITDPNNNTVVNLANMTAQGAPATCNSNTAASCIYQYQYTVPPGGPIGAWNVRVTAREGTELTVSDFRNGSFAVVIPQPSITMAKTSTLLSDPFNTPAGQSPKRIPGAVVRYDINLSNSGPGTVDAGTLVITDAVPANTAMYVSTSAGNPVVFINGTPASGLTFNYASHVSYSSVGDAGPWSYTPVPDVDGFDPLVRAVRISPAGVMNAAGPGNPSFTLQFRVRIN